MFEGLLGKHPTTTNVVREGVDPRLLVTLSKGLGVEVAVTKAEGGVWGAGHVGVWELRGCGRGRGRRSRKSGM